MSAVQQMQMVLGGESEVMRRRNLSSRHVTSNAADAGDDFQSAAAAVASELICQISRKL